MINENSLLNFTPQLYYCPTKKNIIEKKILEQVASGVLINTGSDNFLITANHVFKNIQINEIIVLINGESVQLIGKIGFYIIENGHDNLDIAILKLSNELSDKIKKKYAFLHYKNIDFSHTYHPDNMYMLLGFINHQTKLKGHTFLATPFGFLTQTKTLKKIETTGLNYRENITLKYNRRKQTFISEEKKSIGPRDLTGLSGGGIWHSKAGKEQPHIECYFLVGIMIEQLGGTNRGIVVGTKINTLLQILSEYFGVVF